ncbi:unnamed protein product, partial [Ectocarpus sp. 13 AM-2016]
TRTLGLFSPTHTCGAGGRASEGEFERWLFEAWYSCGSGCFSKAARGVTIPLTTVGYDSFPWDRNVTEHCRTAIGIAEGKEADVLRRGTSCMMWSRPPLVHSTEARDLLAHTNRAR